MHTQVQHKALLLKDIPTSDSHIASLQAQNKSVPAAVYRRLLQVVSAEKSRKINDTKTAGNREEPANTETEVDANSAPKSSGNFDQSDESVPVEVDDASVERVAETVSELQEWSADSAGAPEDIVQKIWKGDAELSAWQVGACGIACVYVSV
jgi:hypothetical protein